MENYTWLLQNASSPQGVMQIANYLTGDLFGQVLILIIWVLIFVSMPKSDFNKKVISSCFVCFILSYLLQILGVVSDLPLIVNAVGLAGFVMWEIYSQMTT